LFLADAHENRGLLRQAGAVYEFRHESLQRRLIGARTTPSGLPLTRSASLGKPA
jgi:hypothetical protein